MAALVSAHKRVIVTALLWTVISLSAFLTLVQAALVVFSPGGEWQTPDFYQAEVVFVDRATRTAFTEDVETTVDGESLTLTLPRTEADALRPHQTVWILDNYYATPIRPAEFRLTPGRFLSEYPELLLAVALLVLFRLRRSRWGIPPPPANPADPTIFRDDFHRRAERFAQPPSADAP